MPQAAVEATWNELQSRLKQLERRDWWLWSAAVVVMILQTLAVVAVALPTLLKLDTSTFETLYDLNVSLGIRSLVGLVLLFNTYAIYQQVLIKRLRRDLADQIMTAASSQLLAAELQELAMRDPLTGLYNRRFVESHMVVEFARAERRQYMLTLLLLDLNNFKEVNDRFGHPAGDFVLTEFANHLNKICRGSDLAARVGGDEFILLLPECHPRQVPIVLSRLTGLEVEVSGTKIPVSFSAGWAEYQAGDRPEQLLKRADESLYAEKSTGKVQEGIRQAQKMQTMGQLAGEVAHDLNNLLMVIKSYSELLMDDRSVAHLPRKHLEEIQKASDRATALTRRLLSFSRKQALVPEALNLNHVIVDVHAMVSRLIGEHIQVKTNLEPELGHTKADRSQIEQIILNLSVNARDAMPDGGTLTIATANTELDDVFARSHRGARPGNYVMVSVCDTGCGMSGETMQRVFEPFFTTKEIGKGTGIGLATVYGIVKQSAGYIWVESELNRGSTFTVYLPREHAAVAATL